MKVYEGSILTSDAQDHVYKYLVEDGGRIVYVGDELPAKFASGSRVKLGDRALIPAFGDSHIHFASFATFHAGLNVSDARSNVEILEMIHSFVPTCDDKMVIAFGASPHSVAEKKFVTRQELDEVCPDKPLFMVKYDGHTCVVNTKLLDILKEKGVSVATNPMSNMKLASGIANVPEMLRRGINVAIGTDSVASNNSLNFFEEMKMFAIAPKIRFNDPTLITPKQTLYAATRAGALAQGREDAGLVKEGFKADLIMIDLEQPNMYPVHDLMNNLVYSASGTDIVMTMSDGRIVYENGEYKTLDIEKTMFEAQAATKVILSKL